MMNPLRTIVIMKTDISGSTSRFRELLAADLQALLSEHRDFLARHAAEHDGRILVGISQCHRRGQSGNRDAGGVAPNAAKPR